MSDTEKSASSNNKFLKGTLILTVSSIVVKVIGSLNWIICRVYWAAKGSAFTRWGFRSI
mgnify:CR=1 FL=1